MSRGTRTEALRIHLGRGAPSAGPQWPEVWAVDEGPGLPEPGTRLVVSDDRELLARVAHERPSTLRIWLTDAAPRTVDALVAHQVLPTWVHPTELTMAVDYQLGGDGLAGWAGPVATDLPSMPTVLESLLNALSDPNSSTRDIEKVIGTDPALTAKILRMANSPCFALPRRVSTLGHAITLLGLNAVRVAAIGASCFDKTMGVDPAEAESVRDVGVRTMAVVRHMAGVHAGEALTAAMLVDIGRLVLARRDRRGYRKLRLQAARQGVPLIRAEVEAYGIHHGLVGAATLSHWGLPASLTRAIAFSHTPYPRAHKARGPRGLVYVATQLVAQQMAEVPAPMPDEWVGDAGLADAVTEASLFLGDVAMQAV